MPIHLLVGVDMTRPGVLVHAVGVFSNVCGRYVLGIRVLLPVLPHPVVLIRPESAGMHAMLVADHHQSFSRPRTSCFIR